MNDELYGRRCSLIIADRDGNGLELSQLRVRFTVEKADTQSPAHANIRIYNLSDATAKQIQQEFTLIKLSAGYEGNFALIFSGTVRQYRKGRESPTDTFLDILAQDGDIAYNFAVANSTLAAGWDQEAAYDRVIKSFDPYGIKTGYTPEWSNKQAPRGKVMFGMSRDFMRGVADAAGTSWHIDNGAINLVPVAATLPGEAVVLTSATGMVGLPQQTVNGVTVRSLLNPRIRHGGQIQLDNNSIQQQAFNVAFQPGGANLIFKQDGPVVENTGLDADGFYKVYAITLIGDTRGQEWYSDIICAGVNATSPTAGVFINTVASSTGF